MKTYIPEIKDKNHSFSFPIGSLLIPINKPTVDKHSMCIVVSYKTHFGFDNEYIMYSAKLNRTFPFPCWAAARCFSVVESKKDINV